MVSNERVICASELDGVWDEPEGRVVTVRATIRKVSAAAATDAKAPADADQGALLQTIVSRFAILQGQVLTSDEQRLKLFRISNRSDLL